MDHTLMQEESVCAFLFNRRERSIPEYTQYPEKDYKYH